MKPHILRFLLCILAFFETSNSNAWAYSTSCDLFLRQDNFRAMEIWGAVEKDPRIDPADSFSYMGCVMGCLGLCGEYGVAPLGIDTKELSLRGSQSKWSNEILERLHVITKCQKQPDDKECLKILGPPNCTVYGGKVCQKSDQFGNSESLQLWIVKVGCINGNDSACKILKKRREKSKSENLACKSGNLTRCLEEFKLAAKIDPLNAFPSYYDKLCSTESSKDACQQFFQFLLKTASLKIDDRTGRIGSIDHAQRFAMLESSVSPQSALYDTMKSQAWSSFKKREEARLVRLSLKIGRLHDESLSKQCSENGRSKNTPDYLCQYLKKARDP